MTALLSVQGLRAGYGPINVLHGIDLAVEPGEIVVMLGANGAGKTTTMRAISGMIPRHGSISFEGADISKAAAEQIVKAGLAQVPQGRGTFPELNVEDNLRIGAFTRRDREIDLDIDLWYETFPRLAERRRQRAGSLSGGEQQMLAIGRALMQQPKLLILDEPSLGLAPLLVQQVRDVIAEINEQGTSVLLIEQNANMALSIAHHGYIMETGKMVMDGSAEKLLRDEDVQEFYLGLHGEGERKSFRDVKHYKRRKRWLS